jgi:hypothetical protein
MPWLRWATRFELVGERNEETAQLFGNGEQPAATAQQPVLIAHAEAPAITAPVAAPVATTRTATAVVVDAASAAAQSRTAIAIAAGGTR